GSVANACVGWTLAATAPAAPRFAAASTDGLRDEIEWRQRVRIERQHRLLRRREQARDRFIRRRPARRCRSPRTLEVGVGGRRIFAGAITSLLIIEPGDQIRLAIAVHVHEAVAVEVCGKTAAIVVGVARHALIAWRFPMRDLRGKAAAFPPLLVEG